MSWLPLFLDSRLIDGGEVSLARRPPFTPRKIPGTHFCYRQSRPQGHIAAGRIRSVEKIHLIWTRNRDFPACSTVPQPITLPRAPFWTLGAEHNPEISRNFLFVFRGLILRYSSYIKLRSCKDYKIYTKYIM
jgi:hypothetical protein